MGAVHVDIYKKEREFKNLTLSDENVVKYMILYRNKVDVSYGANTNININLAGDMFEFNQELICLYVSLDKLVEKIDLNEKEQKILELIFKGDTIADIIKYNGYPRKTAYRILNKLVEKITKENNKDWKETMDKLGFVK